MEIGKGWAVPLLFVVSFGLRYLVLGTVTQSEVPLLYDESSYFDRGLAFGDLFVGWSRLEAPSDELWNRAYGQGHWPPLHPMLLGVGLAIGGPTVAVARLVMVLLSALTTPLVFRLTLALASSRAAWAAAGVHLLYPTLIGYSHYLWSETTAILLLLSAVWLAIRTSARAASTAGAGRRQTLLLAAATGTALGLGALTRAAALPCIVIVPLWLAATIDARRWRLAVAAVTLAAGLIVLLPWQALAAAREGRFVALSTLAGYNLALGNNPWVPEGYGSSWGHEASKALLHARLHEVAQSESVSWQDAGYVVARREVEARPGAFLRRSLERLRMLWAPDFFPLRHLFNAVYPPMPPSLAGLVSVASVTAYFVVMMLSLIGLQSPAGLAHRSLIVSLLAAGMLLPAVTLGMSRLHLPLLALLLPAAGHGLSTLLPPAAVRPRRATIVAGLLVIAISASTLPRVVALYLDPSSYYAPVFAALPGVDVTCSDRILLRWSGGPPDALRIRLLDPQTRWTDGGREKPWSVDDRSAQLDLSVLIDTPEPWEIEISSSAHRRAVRLQPVTRPSWRTWQPTGLAGLEIQWAGGGRPS